jgi:hypothetical protein
MDADSRSLYAKPDADAGPVASNKANQGNDHSNCNMPFGKSHHPKSNRIPAKAAASNPDYRLCFGS